MSNHPNEPAAVAQLQRYLRQIAFDEEIFPAPPIDGIFASATEEALRAYQQSRGFPVTGNADQETWERLYADYRASLSRNSPPRTIAVFPLEPDGYVLTDGSIGFAVSAVQAMLRELQHARQELEAVQITGIYDPQTADAVRVFQGYSQLPIDGLVGLLTWNAIADQYNRLFTSARDE